MVHFTYITHFHQILLLIKPFLEHTQSRRALRALRALVKLQAVVRGHILRKRNVDKLRQLQALVRAQARARAGRLLIEESTKPSQLNHTVRHWIRFAFELSNVLNIYLTGESRSRNAGRCQNAEEKKREGAMGPGRQGCTSWHGKTKHEPCRQNHHPLVSTKPQLRPYHVVEYIPAFPHIRPRRQRNRSSKRALFTPAKSSLSSCTEHPSYVAYKVVWTLRWVIMVTRRWWLLKIWPKEQSWENAL